MKFLIDECLTVELVTIANHAGYHAEHVARVGKASWNDWSVLRHARDRDLILVTNNASDFRRLYAAEALHAGLVILLPNVPRSAQEALFRAVLAELARLGEPVNQVIEADLDGEDTVLTVYDLPPPNG